MSAPSWAADEEMRAQLWRDQTTRRVAFQTEMWNAMAGSQAAREALYADWQPLLDYLAERDMAVDAEAEVDPIGISDTVNVGT